MIKFQNLQSGFCYNPIIFLMYLMVASAEQSLPISFPRNGRGWTTSNSTINIDSFTHRKSLYLHVDVYFWGVCKKGKLYRNSRT